MVNEAVSAGRGEDITGRVFGRLIAVKPTELRHRGGVVWLCRCQCGSEKHIPRLYLCTGHAKSCGCLAVDVQRQRHFSHGYTRNKATPEGIGIYESWRGMKSRCDYEGNTSYSSYGGKGITYDPAWKQFSVFLADMKATWFAGAHLHRKDPKGPYCAVNCVWLSEPDHMMHHRNLSHCRHGHEYSKQNAYFSGGTRRCRQCDQAAKLRFRQRSLARSKVPA